MPIAKVHVCEGKYDEVRLGKVSRAIEDGLVSALDISSDAYFQIVHILPRGQFLDLGLKYSDDVILLELTQVGTSQGEAARITERVERPTGRRSLS
jgi:hypothetical protein